MVDLALFVPTYLRGKNAGLENKTSCSAHSQSALDINLTMNRLKVGFLFFFFKLKPCSHAWLLRVFKASSGFIMASLDDTFDYLEIEIKLLYLVNSLRSWVMRNLFSISVCLSQ